MNLASTSRLAGIASALAVLAGCELAPSLVLKAQPSAIDPGDASSLSWKTRDAESCRIDNGIGPLAGDTGSLEIRPLRTTAYTLTCEGDGGTRSANATVTVATSVAIVSFEPTPATIDPGQSTVLSWTTANAASCLIDNGVGSAPVPDGISIVSPAATTTFTLECEGEAGPAQRSATVVVRDTQILSFEATPPQIDPGASSMLSWETVDATSCAIDNGAGEVGLPDGQVSVSPATDTVYDVPERQRLGLGDMGVRWCHLDSKGHIRTFSPLCGRNGIRLCAPADRAGRRLRLGQLFL